MAPDRVISTVDVEAHHGYRAASQRYDGYKGRIVCDPDSEIITHTTVTPANTADAEATEGRLDDVAADTGDGDAPTAEAEHDEPPKSDADAEANTSDAVDPATEAAEGAAAVDDDGLVVYGGTAYGSGDNLERLDRLGATKMAKTQPAVTPGGRYTKDDFTIELGAATVTCPAGARAPIGFRWDGSGVASFGGQ